MVVSGQEVVEALERAGFRVERFSGGSAMMTHGDRVVFVPQVTTLDEAALVSVLLNAGLTLSRLIELLEPPTLRDLHLESYVRVRRVG
jgi:predicted RNA binding protein YcfA (HicA-like mRNA interferase family)